MKTYDIELQRLKSARHNNDGQVSIGLDALVQARAARDEATLSHLHLSVDDARTLVILLKQQIAELDKLQPRSRRSGRC